MDYYAHREHWSSYGHDVFTHVAAHPKITRLYGEGEIVTVLIRETSGDEKSNYWGWRDAKTGEYSMIYPSLAQARICFPYGPEAEEKAGRGKLVNLVVEART